MSLYTTLQTHAVTAFEASAFKPNSNFHHTIHKTPGKNIFAHPTPPLGLKNCLIVQLQQPYLSLLENLGLPSSTANQQASEKPPKKSPKTISPQAGQQ